MPKIELFTLVIYDGREGGPPGVEIHTKDSLDVRRKGIIQSALDAKEEEDKDEDDREIQGYLDADEIDDAWETREDATLEDYLDFRYMVDRHEVEIAQLHIKREI